MNNFKPLFLKQWPGDPYATARTAAIKWLGPKYLLAGPINKTRREIKSHGGFTGGATRKVL